MTKIIWTDNRWEIDLDGIIWLCADVINRDVQIPNSIFKIRDKLMKASK